jgi:hypothetical protein
MCLVQNKSNILPLATVTLATNSDIASEIAVLKKINVSDNNTFFLI